MLASLIVAAVPLLALPAPIDGRPRAWVGAFEGVGAAEMRVAVRRALGRHVTIAREPAGVPVVTGRVVRQAGRWALWLAVSDEHGALRAEQGYALDDPRLYTAMPAQLAELVRRLDRPAPSELPADRPRAYLAEITGSRGAELQRGLGRALERRVTLAGSPEGVPVIDAKLIPRPGGSALRLTVFDATGALVGFRVYALRDPRLYATMNGEIAALVTRAAGPVQRAPRAYAEPWVPVAQSQVDSAPMSVMGTVPTRAPPPPVAPEPPVDKMLYEGGRSPSGLDEEPPDLRPLQVAPRSACAAQIVPQARPALGPCLLLLGALALRRGRAVHRRALWHDGKDAPRRRRT